MRDPDRLAVYRFARTLVPQVYDFIDSLPADERFNLVSQMRRSSTSIRDNIADGAGRQSDSAMLPKLYDSHSSARELAGQLQQAVDVGAGDTRTAKRLKHDVDHLRIMLMRFITKVENDLGIDHRRRRYTNPSRSRRPRP